MYELYRTAHGDRTLVGYYSDTMECAAAIEEDMTKHDDEAAYEYKRVGDHVDGTGIQPA